MNPDDLLAVADGLATGGGPGRPRQVELRRAVSTTYYALFHTLANTCADLLVGPRSTGQTNQAWRQAYRALDHGEVKSKCTRGPGKPILDNHFPQAIRDFARQFVKMQEIRHKADYDPLSRLHALESCNTLKKLEQPLTTLRMLPIETAAHLPCLYCSSSEETRFCGHLRHMLC